jgi:exodeoxyribonuclease-3
LEYKTDVIKILEIKRIRSTYHSFYREEFGVETKHTLFMHHNEEKHYHVDYCFASGNFKLENVEIGTYSDWHKSSDHVPIIITFDDAK